MNSNDSISVIIGMMYEIKETVSTLNERSKFYYEIQHEQAEKINKMDVRLQDVEMDNNLFKRDRWWFGTITSIIGCITAFLVTTIINIFSK